MARVYSDELWADDDVLSPHDPNRELGLIAGEMNGHVSADNLPAAEVTGNKVALDVFHGLLWIDGAGPDSFTRNNSDPLEWFVVETGSLVTGDGLVKVEGGLTYDFPSGLSQWAEVGVRIDGEVVARSGSTNYLESESPSCMAASTVGPGTHTVELVFRISPGQRTSPPTSSLTATVNGRSLWAHYLAR